MLRILQVRLQQYMNQELPDVEVGFRNCRGTRVQLLTSTGISKKQKNSRKTSTSASLTTPKPLTVWITTNCGRLFKRWEYQTTLPASWEICVQVKKQQLDLDMKQQTGSKLGKEYVKAIRRRQWQPTPVLLPGESHGRRSLVGYSPWGCEGSDMTEWLNWTEVN